MNLYPIDLQSTKQRLLLKQLKVYFFSSPEIISKLIETIAFLLQPQKDYAMAATINEAIELLRQLQGWPPGYFEQTVGSLADDPMVIPDDG